MGLIGGVLTPLYVGGPSVLMPPTSFLKRPLRWLEAISARRATISGAPDFAYRLCVERIDEADREALDLSSWRLAFCGAEPIHAGTLAGFADAFETSGFRASSFYPCYGLAESTLLAAGPEHGQPPTVLSVDRAELGKGRAVASTGEAACQQLVGCGTAPLGHELLIADPQTLAPLPDRTVGEIFVRGPSVAAGYWRRSEESAGTFNAEVEGHGAGFLRTGDLGFVYEGDLFVTGRQKDVIILRGRNHYPQDIEQTAEAAHQCVQTGAALACEIEGQERLVLVHQLDRACRGESQGEVVEAIRRAVAMEHEIDPYAIVLIRQSSLPVTSSGKVQRGLCRERYLAGDLNVLHEWTAVAAQKSEDSTPPPPQLDGLSTDAAAERIEEWMLAWLAGHIDLDADAAGRDRPFAELGLDSLTAIELSSELEAAFGVPLPPVVAWNYPTPAALAGYLAEQSHPRPTDEADADLESLLAEIEAMPDEEVERKLREE